MILVDVLLFKDPDPVFFRIRVLGKVPDPLDEDSHHWIQLQKQSSSGEGGRSDMSPGRPQYASAQKKSFRQKYSVTAVSRIRKYPLKR